MSFMGYVQALWSPSGSATGASSRTDGLPFPSAGPSPGSASAQQLGSGVWPLSAVVKEELKKGIRYNMKVILRGTRATGKSTLMAHLSGHPQPARYTPSTELMASTMRLQGEHCAPNEGIKVDIWEVVEESRQRSAMSSSPNDRARVAGQVPSAQLHEALRVAADARLLDVYAGCQLVIFMIHPGQRASWEYAKQETLHVPPTCCVLYALNFADLEPFSASGGAVTLHEVESWCSRTRRATTGVVHRMVEGRQAPAAFSVRPMVAVLSAQNGTGMLGVTRALHVASTLLRVAAEEVRVQRLFSLLARQQAVSVLGGRAEPTTHTHSPAAMARSAAGVGTSAGSATEHLLRQPSTQSPPTPGLTALSTGAAPAESAAPAAPAAPPLPSKPGLRMEHRTKATTAAGGASGDGNTNGAPAHPARPMTDMEAMRHFLGGSGSSASGRSSTRSASSTSSSGAPAMRGDSRLNGYAVPQLRRPSHVTAMPTPPPVHASTTMQTEKHAAVEGEVNAASDNSVPQAAAAPRDPPTEEMVNVLAATMVHDVGRPADNFFADESDGEAAAGDDGDDSAATPTATAETGVRTARLLETHRMARRGDTAAEASAAAEAPPALSVDVSTLLAQMTAALTSEVPTDDASGAAAAAAAATKKKKKPKRSARGGEDGQAERHHHRKRRGCTGADDTGMAVAPAADAAEAEDDGSFELVLV